MPINKSPASQDLKCQIPQLCVTQANLWVSDKQKQNGRWVPIWLATAPNVLDLTVRYNLYKATQHKPQSLHYTLHILQITPPHPHHSCMEHYLSLGYLEEWGTFNLHSWHLLVFMMSPLWKFLQFFNLKKSSVVSSNTTLYFRPNIFIFSFPKICVIVGAVPVVRILKEMLNSGRVRIFNWISISLLSWSGYILQQSIGRRLVGWN